jgi:hypothetical protein
MILVYLIDLIEILLLVSIKYIIDRVKGFRRSFKKLSHSDSKVCFNQIIKKKFQAQMNVMNLEISEEFSPHTLREKGCRKHCLPATQMMENPINKLDLKTAMAKPQGVRCHV